MEKENMITLSIAEYEELKNRAKTVNISPSEYSLLCNNSMELSLLLKLIDMHIGIAPAYSYLDSDFLEIYKNLYPARYERRIKQIEEEEGTDGK